MASITGSLRFFVIDGAIYDNNGAYKDYAWSDVQPSTQNLGTFNQPIGDGGAEQLIIPHPTLCNHYYIFGVITYWSGDSGNLLPEDSTVNALSLPGFTSTVPAYALYDAANGVVVNRGLWYTPHPTFISTNLTNPIFTDVSTANPANTNGDSQVTASLWLSDADYGTASIASSDLRPDGSRYIGCKMKNNIYFIRISASGTLSYWKRYNHSSIISANGCRAEMEINFDNVTNTFKIAFESRTGAAPPSGGFSTTYCIKYFELSNNLLTSINQQSINLPFYLYIPPSNYDDKPVAGIEFSPNKRYIYLTSASTNGGLTQRLYTIDLSVGSPTVTPFTVTSSVQEQVKYGSIET